MKNHTLILLGLLLATIGILSNLVLDSIIFGLALQITGFLLMLINLMFVLIKMHEKRKVYKRKLKNSELY